LRLNSVKNKVVAITCCLIICASICFNGCAAAVTARPDVNLNYEQNTDPGQDKVLIEKEKQYFLNQLITLGCGLLGAGIAVGAAAIYCDVYKPGSTLGILIIGASMPIGYGLGRLAGWAIVKE